VTRTKVIEKNDKNKNKNEKYAGDRPLLDIKAIPSDPYFQGY
jgi:hypothetical protein